MMDMDIRIKCLLFTFSIMFSRSSSYCEEYNRNDCSRDFFCTGDNEDWSILLNGNYYYNDYDCSDKKIISKSTYYKPVRIKIESKDVLQSFLQYFDKGMNYDYYDRYNNKQLKEIVILLEITNTLINVIPDFPTMPNLKTLTMSHNELRVAKLFNRAELVALENVDLSHNSINTIEVDTKEYVFQFLRILNLSNNLLTNIPGGVFQLFKNLESLDLSNNNIVDIDPLSFMGLNNLIYLYLSSNNISKINQALTGLEHLKELYFENNDIANLSTPDFISLKGLETLNLDFNKISSVHKDTFIHMESLTILKLHSNLLSHIHKDAFISANSLKIVDLSNNLLKDLPKDLFKHKTITSILIYENNLEGAISQGTFEGLQLITSLNVSYQAITAIEELGFYGLTKLKILLLNNNKIRTISENSFDTLVSLEHLDLSNNLIVSLDFSKRGLISIQKFLLSNNFIKQIMDTDLQGMNNIKFLDLSNNNISTIAAGSFKTLPLVESLKLYNNPINGTLLSNTFKGLFSLQTLNLTHNTLLTSIHNSSFNGMVRLQKVNISRNSIKELEYSAFINTSNIELIDLSFNKLSVFYVDGSDLKRLRTLYLNNNAIYQICNNNFGNLQQLIMGNNNIAKIEGNALRNMSKLDSLDLSFNNISYVERGSFNNNKVLINLNLSHNALDNLNYSMFRGLDKLDTLDISFNNIHDIKANKFYDIKQLRTLIADYNRITDDGIYFSNLNWKFLSIGHNLLSCEKIISLMQMNSFTVSAIKIDEYSGDNIDGIVCNLKNRNRITDLRTNETNSYTSITENNLFDTPDDRSNSSEIRESIVSLAKDRNDLLNISILIKELNKYVVNQTVQLNNIKLEVTQLKDADKIERYNSSNEVKRTNSLLESILKVIVINRTMEHSINSPLSSTDNVGNIQNDMSFGNYSKLDALALDKFSEKPYVYLEVCVTLILLILISFFVYKIYVAKITNQKHYLNTPSTVSESFDNSNL